MPLLQDIVHRFEVGGMRVFRTAVIALVVVMLCTLYYWRGYRNLATEEAMDCAQLARNLARGNGFTTQFVRPFSMCLMKKRNLADPSSLQPGQAADWAQIKDGHPDLANAPLYPALLAALMKVLPFNYNATITKWFWSSGGQFLRYQPDFLISLFNLLLFLALVAVVFFIARALFDPGVAWLSAFLVLANEQLWRFMGSGLPTLLLLLIFMVLVWCLVLIEREAREPKGGPATLLTLSVITGAVLGLGALTRYSFGWLLLPVLLQMVLFSGPRRVVLALAVLGTFCAVMAPWLLRNYHLSHTLFGVAGYADLEGTFFFPGNRLPRSLEPDLSRHPITIWLKFVPNARQILLNDLPRLGGSWVSGFFLVGLMLGFRNLALRRLRYFLCVCIITLGVAQALGRTHLSDDSPEITSENLLILLVPIVFIYGVSLFFSLLQNMALPAPELRYVVIGLFSVAACLPTVFFFVGQKASPVVFPPYHPPTIQKFASWLGPNELMMSDIPWAVAWYGDRQSAWLTLKAAPDNLDPNTHEDVAAINDYQKHIAAIFITARTTEASLFSELRAEPSWGHFVVYLLKDKVVPPNFPLNQMLPNPESNLGQLFVADWPRWLKD